MPPTAHPSTSSGRNGAGSSRALRARRSFASDENESPTGGTAFCTIRLAVSPRKRDGEDQPNFVIS
ncbi:MAG: hypothetical protein QOJ29_400 [Thermoleophilaceae bacterium]|jgi:hypothetical protein|nr:hypothetical protein [Thermoleophilaceae bacterium]